MATKTVKKKYIKYYVSVSNTTTGKITYYAKDTKSEDYSPFIEYENNSSWTAIDELPNEELFLLKFTTSTIIAKVENELTDENTEENEVQEIADNEEELAEEQDLEITYYYNYYETDVDLDRYIKGICADCKYCHIVERFRKKYTCSCSEHIFKDYITGEVRNGDCKDFNENGECRYYYPTISPEENTENGKTNDEDETEKNKNDENDDVDKKDETKQVDNDKTNSDTEQKDENNTTETNTTENNNSNASTKDDSADEKQSSTEPTAEVE